MKTESEIERVLEFQLKILNSFPGKSSELTKVDYNIWEKSTWIRYYKHLCDGLGSYNCIRKFSKKANPRQDIKQRFHCFCFRFYLHRYFVLIKHIWTLVNNANLWTMHWERRWKREISNLLGWKLWSIEQIFVAQI